MRYIISIIILVGFYNMPNIDRIIQRYVFNKKEVI